MARSPDASAADAAAYAAIVARLAHRFADRAGVLEVRGLDDATFERLERDALARLQHAAMAGDTATLAAFGRAVAEARLALLHPVSAATLRQSGAAPSAVAQSAVVQSAVVQSGVRAAGHHPEGDGPATVAAPSHGSPATTAFPRPRGVGATLLDEPVSSNGPTQVTDPPDHEASVVDVLDLMETLHSKGGGTPPTSS